jgi:hypothetical protein
LVGAFWPDRAAGRPSGQVKAARVQYSRVVAALQPALTGLVNVTVTRTGCRVPAAQFGWQSSTFSVPLPTASVAVHVCQVMSRSRAVLSPDSTQSAAQDGRYSAVPATSPLSAKYTFAPDGDAPAPVATGVADAGLAGTEALTDAEAAADGADEALSEVEAVAATLAGVPSGDEGVLLQPASKAIAATGRDNIKTGSLGI